MTERDTGIPSHARRLNGREGTSPSRKEPQPSGARGMRIVRRAGANYYSEYVY